MMDENFGASEAMQGNLFPEMVDAGSTIKLVARQGTFADNMRLPIHRWFRYSAGFSADWVQKVVKEAGGAGLNVLDPFAGSATTVIAASELGASATGIEAHPFVFRIARAKLIGTVIPAALRAAGEEMVRLADRLTAGEAPDSALLAKCYEPAALDELGRLKAAYSRMKRDEDVRELLWLALTAILRECSYVGTAQWQYVLPNKRKSKTRPPVEAFLSRIDMFCADLTAARRANGAARMFSADARTLNGSEIGDGFDLVVTSPPYPNNYDYADATRLEMSFWGEVSSWGDLHAAVRSKLLCSCSQHSAAERMDLDSLLADPLLEPIRTEIAAVCHELSRIRETKGGKKTYHTMVAAYFLDLARVWQTLRPLMRDGSQVHYVIGDAAPYGVYVPCDVWLGKLAIATGFKDYSFTKLRDRNTKWKNRKHTVPLKEGILRVNG